MSWDPYIDNLVSQSKKNGAEHIDKAIIIDKDSGAPWTAHATKHLRVSAVQGSALIVITYASSLMQLMLQCRSCMVYSVCPGFHGVKTSVKT